MKNSIFALGLILFFAGSASRAESFTNVSVGVGNFGFNYTNVSAPAFGGGGGGFYPRPVSPCAMRTCGGGVGVGVAVGVGTHGVVPVPRYAYGGYSMGGYGYGGGYYGVTHRCNRCGMGTSNRCNAGYRCKRCCRRYGRGGFRSFSLGIRVGRVAVRVNTGRFF